MAAIPDWFVKKYYDDIHILSQQLDSRFRQRVRVEMATGESHFFDRLGKVTAVELVSRHQATPITDPDHTRRRAVIRDWVANPILDKQDVLRLKEGKAPLKDYARVAIAEINRKMDDTIIDAMGGTAFGGQDGATSIAFPSGQKVVVGTTGMSITKLRDTRQLLDLADVDPDAPRYIMVPPKAINTDLLADSTLTSVDFNTVKVLVDGQVDTFMGFKFIKTNRLKKDGSGDWLCYAWIQPGVGLAMPEDIVRRIDERSDLNYAWQAYTKWAGGGTRIEDEMVVEIAIKP